MHGEAIHQQCQQVYIYAYTPKNAGWYIYTNLRLGEYINIYVTRSEKSRLPHT